jgi:hypothetical protein
VDLVLKGSELNPLIISTLGLLQESSLLQRLSSFFLPERVLDKTPIHMPYNLTSTCPSFDQFDSQVLD